jgi:hypothetical protein
MAFNCHAAKRKAVTFPDLSISIDPLRAERHSLDELFRNKESRIQGAKGSSV